MALASYVLLELGYKVNMQICNVYFPKFFSLIVPCLCLISS